jgi:hypothetical protein
MKTKKGDIVLSTELSARLSLDCVDSSCCQFIRDSEDLCPVNSSERELIPATGNALRSPGLRPHRVIKTQKGVWILRLSAAMRAHGLQIEEGG